ncbi:MAG: ATP-dependent DNA helicase RecG [Clostridia bacterium]|nr:ATP-dependent DNA helicase RecG [Clostridia bacterium]
MNIFNTPLTVLNGVGQKRCELLNSLGIKSLYDLIYFLPSGYEDRRIFCDIENVAEGDEVCIKACLKTVVRSVRVKNKLTISNCIIYDETGEIMVVWYNQRFVEKQLIKDREYNFYGRVKKSKGRLELSCPIFEPSDNNKGYTGKIVPVYPLLSKISQKTFYNIMASGIEYAKKLIPDILPKCVQEKFKIPDINESVYKIHFPENEHEASAARRRFAFEEFFYFQVMLSRIRKSGKQDGIIFKNLQTDFFEEKLPFKLTDAQKKVVSEIKSDFVSGKQMNRLLQGDVGSGKTIVAAVATKICNQNGLLSAIIAPTEILAKQHYSNFVSYMPECNIRLLTSSCTRKEKNDILKEISDKKVDILIGTHAVLEDNVELENLGLVVIDEQHRFGVRQRQKLINKGLNPHLLVMTATPIPRTLSLIMFNDLNVSVIDVMPKGRMPVKTYLVSESYRQRVYTFLEKEISSGGQAYIVCPLVEENENSDLKNAVGFAEELKSKIPHLKIGVLHGKMKDEEKSSVMDSFKDKRIDVLVATTVIEVGVDVKNATLMIVENAERFGLSQLHQLRGRVGRGEKQSYCIMIAKTSNEDTVKRLKVIESSNDGFYISEQDLKQRGPGDFLGTRQHGLPSISLPVGEDDLKLLYYAKQAVEEINAKILVPTSTEKQIMKYMVEKMANSENNANILN